MGCDHFQHLLPEYLMGECDEITRQQIAQHIDSCENCRVEYQSLKEVVDYFQNDPLEYNLEGVHNNILKEAEEAIRSESRPVLFPAIISIMAALFLAAISIHIFGDNIRDMFGSSASALSGRDERMAVASRERSFHKKSLNNFAKSSRGMGMERYVQKTLPADVTIARLNEDEKKSDPVVRGGSGSGSDSEKLLKNYGLKKGGMARNALPPLSDLSKADIETVVHEGDAVKNAERLKISESQIAALKKEKEHLYDKGGSDGLRKDLDFADTLSNNIVKNERKKATPEAKPKTVATKSGKRAYKKRNRSARVVARRGPSKEDRKLLKKPIRSTAGKKQGYALRRAPKKAQKQTISHDDATLPQQIQPRIGARAGIQTGENKMLQQQKHQVKQPVPDRNNTLPRSANDFESAQIRRATIQKPVIIKKDTAPATEAPHTGKSFGSLQTDDQLIRQSKRKKAEEQSLEHLTVATTASSETDKRVSLESLYRSKKYEQIVMQLKDNKKRSRREQIYYYRSLLKLKRCHLIKTDRKEAFKYLSLREQEQFQTLCEKGAQMMDMNMESDHH